MLTRTLKSSYIGLFALALALSAPAALGQMPQQSQEMLSSSDVGDEELQMVVSAVVSAQMGIQEERMKLRKRMIQMKQNMQEMDSTEKVQEKRKLRMRQKKMQMKMQQDMKQAVAEKEGIEWSRAQRILQSIQQDQELGKRFKKVMKMTMKERQPQGDQNPNPQNQ